MLLVSRVPSSEGVRGLYRGFGAVAVGSAPGMSLYLTTYEAAKGFLSEAQRAGTGEEKKFNFLTHFTAGMLAEVVW